ncbi:MAG: hypothetical protein ACHQ1E_10250 [Ktedonobacterales bacterium]
MLRSSPVSLRLSISANQDERRAPPDAHWPESALAGHDSAKLPNQWAPVYGTLGEVAGWRRNERLIATHSG